MKKLALLFAIAFIAAFATPAMASDFMAGGQARYEAVNFDDGDSDDHNYFDQRYRVAFTWKVNDNVTTQLRADFAESNWGQGYRPAEGKKTIMVDRAWVKVNQGPLTLTVGQQGGQLGHGMIWSDQFQGVIANLDFAPIQVRLLYAKESEGAFDDDSDDWDTYAGQLNLITDAFNGGITYGYTDNQSTDMDLAGYGAHFTAPVGGLTLKGALAMFDGDMGPIDYAGTQAFVSADMAVTDAFSLGATAIWADEVDSDELQAVVLQDDGVFNILDWGGAMGWNNVLSYMPYGNDIFDLDGFGNGVIGGLVRAQWAATDTLTFWAKFAYAEPNGSSFWLDSAMYYNANVDWVWVPSVTVSAGVAVYDPDGKSGFDVEEEILSAVQLTVAF